jgi:ppGpp synthetase/RelA/SpoT-type nucleotidyltranferase
MPDFDESLHPRGDGGKFSETGGSSKQAGAKRVAEATTKKQIAALSEHRARTTPEGEKPKRTIQEWNELKKQRINYAEATGPLPKGKTEAEHIATAEKAVAEHKASIKKNEERLKAIAPKLTVTARAKEAPNAVEKLRRKVEEAEKAGKETKYPDASKLGDLTGARMVAKSVEDAREAVQTFKEHYPDAKIDDRFNTADPDKPGQPGGYRSFHIDYVTPEGLKAELQIRTANQHEYAEWAHDAYKPQNEAQRELKDTPEVHKYAQAMSDYFWKQDSGEDPGPRPEASEEIKHVFGEPGRAIPEYLPERHDKYFNTKGSTTVKMEQLVTIRARPEGITHAKELMIKSFNEGGSKRDPISVRENKNGTYTVLDGNSTTAVARDQNWRKMPVRIVERE